MNTMERLHLFSTRRMRDRLKQATLRAEGIPAETARIADFQARLLARRMADEEAEAMSPAEKSEAQSRSSAERRKYTPAV
jgi:hypothetical protein